MPVRAVAAMEGRAAPAAAFLSPVARDYPSRALDGFFRPPRCDCSIKEREDVASACGKEKCFLFTTFHTPQSVNNLGAIWLTGYSQSPPMSPRDLPIYELESALVAALAPAGRRDRAGADRLGKIDPGPADAAAPRAAGRRGRGRRPAAPPAGGPAARRAGRGGGRARRWATMSATRSGSSRG